MANINLYTPFLASWEGGFVKLPGDPGGYTNKGITLATWKSMGYDKDGDGDIDVNDLRAITNEDMETILKEKFWDKWKADNITSQSIANLLVDWLYNSGAYGIKIPQRVLGVAQDGKVGPKTLAAINNTKDKKALFEKLKEARANYLRNLVKNKPSNSKFLKGWLRRVNAINWRSLSLNTSPVRITRWIE